jgi:hypothetical protein
MLFYSALRRGVAERILYFMKAMPVYLSFHDQILCLLYLLNGKYIRLQRLFYIYDIGVWAAAESAQKRDIDFYTAAGLDPAANKLQWLLCGFEGAALIMNSTGSSDYSSAQRQVIADQWFAVMFSRFKHNSRMTYESPFTDEAAKLCTKIATSTGQLSFEKILTDVSGFFALFSKQRAHAYFEFWNAVLNKRLPPTY